MDKKVFAVCFAPLMLNLIAFLNKWDYLVSVNSVKVFSKNDWKLFFGISVFSNIFTFFIEVIMLKLDVWSFSSHKARLLGYTFWNAPIEEYVFWMYCPWLVGFSYILFSRSNVDKVIDLSLLEEITKPLASIEKKIKEHIKDNVEYVEDSSAGKYARGSKVPVYLSIQLILITMIVFLKKKYHGSKYSMLLTTILFFITMMPYEQYAISQGFWTYNENKMVGLFILNVPIEGWMMYILPPIAGAMLTDVLSKKFFNKDI